MASFKMPARLGHGVNVLRGTGTVIILDFYFCFTKLETIIFGNASATDRRPGKSKKLGKQEDPLHFTSCIMLMQIMMNSINCILIK